MPVDRGGDKFGEIPGLFGYLFEKRPGGISRHSSSLSRPREKRVDGGDRSSAGVSGYRKGLIDVEALEYPLFEG